MPLFDFECEKCKRVDEYLIVSTVSSTICPTCSGKQFKKISAPGMLFFKQGTGFYKAGASLSDRTTK